MHIRKASISDKDFVWQILHLIIEKGDTYAFAPGSTKEEILAYWFGTDKQVYVVEDSDTIYGSFILKNNQPGLGSHIANAAYAVSPLSRGKGLGKAMGEFSLDEARRLGYKAMQFNLVVKTNESAVRLWKSIGFEIIAEIPEAFEHTELGLVNAYMMYRKL